MDGEVEVYSAPEFPVGKEEKEKGVEKEEEVYNLPIGGHTYRSTF